MPDWYIGSHRHSGYSPMDGLATAEQARDRLLELGQTAMGLCDHGTSAGHPEFFRVFKEAGIKLIPGVEFYHVEDGKARGSKSEGNQNELRIAKMSLPHLTVLTRTQEGYRNLLDLVRISYRENFYYRPRLSWADILPRQKGLTILTGCVGGHLSRLINADREDLAFKWLAYLKQVVEDLQVEIIPVSGLDISERSCKALWKMAGELSLPRIASDDGHFCRRSDHAAQDTMVARSIGKRVDDPDRKMKIPEECFYCSGDEILARLKVVLPDVPESELRAAVANSLKIAERCEVEMPRASGPVFNIAAAMTTARLKPLVPPTPEQLLQWWVNEGIDRRRKTGELPNDITTPEWSVYQKRAIYEFDILRHHNFFNYFLTVADLVRWARQEEILCIARGSCGGSLLCWYLGITEVDPIKYDLPVERFIGTHRRGLPDVDLDCDSRHRDRFYQFLTDKYGQDNCAQIAALSRYRARQALRDVTAAHGLPDEALVEMLDLVPEAAEADEGLKAYDTLKRLYSENERAKALIAQYPAFAISAELEGQVRHSSVHATGFVVDAHAIHQTVGLQGKPSDLPVIACDKDEAERIGLLKIDIIASDTIALLAMAMERLGRPVYDVVRLPLDDEDTYRMLGDGRNAGVFQLQGNAAGRLMRDIQPNCYEDLLAIVALARPGPLQSGGAAHFIARRHGKETRTTFHPLLEAILKPTEGVILFQESVMRIAREIGDLPWDDVETIRKTISKSGGGQAMDQYLDRYLAGARAQDVSERDALVVWEQCKKAGNYLFNKGHGADYAKIAGWTAWVKCQHPALFATCYAWFAADDEKKQEQVYKIFNEFRDLGGKFVLIDPNRSQAHFTAIDDRTILGGFQDLEGCGPKNATKLLAGQPYACWDAFYQACPKTMRDHLHATGIHEGRVDQDAVLHIAPWYVEIIYTDLERAAFQRMSATTVAATHHADRQISLVGRVTQVQIINVVAEAKKYGQRPPGPGEPTTRAVVTLADETGSTLLHISPRRLEQLVAQRKPLRGPYEGVGNSVYAACSWNRPHTKLYCEDLICFREAPLFVPATPEHLDPVLTKKKATRKRKKKADDESAANAGGDAGSEQHDEMALGRGASDSGRTVECFMERGSESGQCLSDGIGVGNSTSGREGRDDRDERGNDPAAATVAQKTAGGNLREKGAVPDPIVDATLWE